MGPVRVGNQAYQHFQHDSYGNVILGVAQAFLDRRLLSPPTRMDFLRLEDMGRQALACYDKPDAGMWELRSRARVHTTSSLMCWAAADRLARIADYIGEPERARDWRVRGGARSSRSFSSGPGRKSARPSSNRSTANISTPACC